MPAEGIHLSALIDTRETADAEVARILRQPAARLGAVLIDLPYFDRFGLELLRYVTGCGPSPSRWGDLFHRQAPAQFGLALLRSARAGGRDGHALTSLALGYLSHIAVDSAVHPLVNRLARSRASANGSTEAIQHREVEKFQSVIFHELRFGADLMGTPTLGDYIDVDGERLLAADGIQRALADALRQVLGDAPSTTQWMGWAKGYRHYVQTLSSPLGLLPARERAKRRERSSLYDAPNFAAHYAKAVERSRRYVRFAMGALEANCLDDAAQFFVVVAEGSVDDPPY